MTRLEEIRRRRADLDLAMDGYLGVIPVFQRHAAEDVAWLLAEHDRLLGEVERLRSAVDIALNDTTGDVSFVQWSIHQLLAARVSVAWDDTMQDLVDLDQEMGLYEEADNPLVKEHNDKVMKEYALELDLLKDDDSEAKDSTREGEGDG